MENEEKLFFVENAKTGKAACKKCKQKCESGALRIAKLIPNFISGSGMMKQWYHIDCLFQAFKNQRATTKKIESVDDIDGWDSLSEAERDKIIELLHSILPTSAQSRSTKTKSAKESKATTSNVSVSPRLSISNSCNQKCEDNLFKTFRDICEKIAADSRYSVKSEILRKFFLVGTNGKKFEGDLYLWIKLLLPSAVPRIYNLQSKQLVKLFSRVFKANPNKMLNDLEQGDVSETVRKFFERSSHIQPKKENDLTMQEVDDFLSELSALTKEDEQIEALKKFCEKCNADDLKIVIRLVKHDLRINAGPRHILDALGPTAYLTFQSSRNLQIVVDKFAPLIGKNKINTGDSIISQIGGVAGTSKSNLGGGVQLMSPISPMLAEACKSVEKAIAKNPDGMYSEVKYDGERVQIHKKGSEFKFFSRSLKPVQDHKIRRCTEFIPKAFPTGQDLILDSEIVMVNTDTGELLPFGTLGKHKKEQFASSEVCLFVFDCIYYNGEDLTKKPLSERKRILKENINPIKYHVELSEYYLLETRQELALMTAKVLKAGLEGLVLKNINGLYQPGKRAWLKVKKDYLFEGQMADTADLVVLGGWFGTGKKGGMLSIFLMGCFDTKSRIWKTVTKVHSGLDDKTMEEIQTQLLPLMERSDSEKLPKWISCKKQSVPDYLAKDPKKMPVWEITGAEFSKAEVHTANGISIRFPRITRIREDKDPEHATTLKELENLFKKSKEFVNVDMLLKDSDCRDDKDELELKTKFATFNECFDNGPNNSEKKLKSEASTSLGRKHRAIDETKVDASLSSIKYVKRLKTEEESKVSAPQIREGTRQYHKGFVEEMDVDIKNELSELFDEIVAFILPEAEDHFKPLIKSFLKRGGSTTQESRSATHVLHQYNQNTESSLLLRQKYQTTCRHLTCKWIEDSIVHGKLMPILEYAVML